ncbi:MAG: BatA domain-containing protein, partial [Gaiellales bacterium]
MTFATPAALWALVLVPLAVVAYVWFQRRRVREAMTFVAPALLPNIVDRVPGWRRHLPPALLLLAVTSFLFG